MFLLLQTERKTITCRPRKEQLSDPQNKLEIFTLVEGEGEAAARDQGKF